MRNLFWFLLLCNVVLFAVMQNGGWGWGEPDVQAQPALHEEMIHLIPAPPSAQVKAAPVTASTPAPAMPAASAPAAVTPVPALSLSNLQFSPTPSASATAEPGTPVCLEWGDFSGTDLTRATAELTALQLADKLTQRQIERDIGYWVYIPPLKNKAAVNRKIAELKALGIREYFVAQNSGRWRNAISLGVFKTQDAAQKFLHDLQTKGVHSAQAGERASKLISTLFVLNKVDAEIKVKLSAIQKDFAGSELNDVPCALTR